MISNCEMFIFEEGVIFSFYLQKVLAGITVQRVREAGSRGKVLHQESAELRLCTVYSAVYSTGVQ